MAAAVSRAGWLQAVVVTIWVRQFMLTINLVFILIKSANYTANLFLADRTNGRSIGTVLRLSVCLSVCRLWRYVLWLNGASQSKSYYWEPIVSRRPIWEIDWYQNEWPWPLFRGRIKVTSTVALHLTLNISETVNNGDRGLVPKDYQ